MKGSCRRRCDRGALWPAAFCAAALLLPGAAQAATVRELALRVERSGLYGGLEVARIAQEDPRPGGLLASVARTLRARCQDSRQAYLARIQHMISFGVEGDLSGPPAGTMTEAPALMELRGRLSDARRALRQEGLNLLGEGLNVDSLTRAAADLRGSLGSVPASSRAGISANLEALSSARQALASCYAGHAAEAAPGYAPAQAASSDGEPPAEGRCLRIAGDIDRAFRRAPREVRRAKARLILALSEVRDGGRVTAFPAPDLTREDVISAVARFSRATPDYELSARQRELLSRLVVELPGIDCSAGP